MQRNVHNLNKLGSQIYGTQSEIQIYLNKIQTDKNVMI